MAAGAEEILNRRVGANKRFVQQIMLAYGDPQFEYATRLHDAGKLRIYALHLTSAPGKQGGLFYETPVGAPPSPLGALVANACKDGYAATRGRPEPFHGYLFRILSAQGKGASGKAYSYM